MAEREGAELAPVNLEPVRACLALVGESPIDMRRVSAALDALDHAQRVRVVRSLGRSMQRRLWEAADGFRPVRLVDLVAPSVADLETVRHFGRNTLPAFTHFEKRFCRPAEVDPEKPTELHGFNFQSLAWLTGPGYFVAREDPGRPEVWIDYRSVPSEHPSGWPEIRPNDIGVSRLVYGFMVDTLRGVSRHVTIGSAAKRGRDIGSWFALCRQDA